MVLNCYMMAYCINLCLLNICSACIKQGVLLLNVNPMLIFVTCRYGYQFISIFSSIFLFIYFFIYLINYILILLYLYQLEYEDNRIIVNLDLASPRPPPSRWYHSNLYARAWSPYRRVR